MRAREVLDYIAFWRYWCEVDPQAVTLIDRGSVSFSIWCGQLLLGPLL